MLCLFDYLQLLLNRRILLVSADCWFQLRGIKGFTLDLMIL